MKSNELEIVVEEATTKNIQIGDTILGIFLEEDAVEEEYYFARVFDIDIEKELIYVSWEYDEEDEDYEINIDEVEINNVYKVKDIEQHIPVRKMPDKNETLNVLDMFK